MRKKRSFYYCFLLILLILPFTLLQASTKPVIIDTDASTDDAMAILYLLHQPAVSVKAIIVDRNGASYQDTAINHVGFLLNLAKDSHLPVYEGIAKKGQYHNVYPESILQAIEVGYHYTDQLPANRISKKALIHLIKAEKEPVTILAIGSATNLADILQLEPSIKPHIKEIIYMAGAISVPGNIDVLIPDTENKSAEWNVFVDPEAFKSVLASGIPILLVPLDITNQALLDMDFMKQLALKRNSPEAAFIYSLLKPSLPWIQSKDYYFWDPLAAVLVSMPVETVTKKINVNLKPGAHYAALTEDNQGYPVSIPIQVPFSKISTILLNGLH